MYAVANVVNVFYSLRDCNSSMTLKETLKQNVTHLQFDLRLPRPEKNIPAHYSPLFYK